MAYDFNIKKMENKIQINVNKWVQAETNLLQFHKMTGRDYLSYITKVTAKGGSVEGLNKGDYILVSKVAADIATSPTSPYGLDGEKYYNIPENQIIGYFKDNVLSYSNLSLLNKNFLYEKVNRREILLLEVEDKNTTIGKVLKVEEGSTLKEGDLVLVKDNVSTPLRLESADYFAAEERSIVGIFKSNDLTFSNIRIINENILMKPYVSKKVLNSNILETPEINYEDLDYSDMYNRDLFKVCYADEATDIQAGDILLLNRDYTNYVYFNNEKYFIIDSKKWISGKIIERDN